MENLYKYLIESFDGKYWTGRVELCTISEAKKLTEYWDDEFGYIFNIETKVLSIPLKHKKLYPKYKKLIQKSIKKNQNVEIKTVKFY